MPHESLDADCLCTDDLWARMSPRVAEVAELLAKGMKNSDIGRALSISPRTVEDHVMDLYLIAGTNNRTALAVYLSKNPRPANPGMSG